MRRRLTDRVFSEFLNLLITGIALYVVMAWARGF
jgi:hypothetical protein